MKTIAMWVLVVAGCAGAEAPPPDAALRAVHDQAFFVPCDPAWTIAGVGPIACESACLVKPADAPCQGATPCNDQAPCQRAVDRGDITNCPATFFVSDYVGQHQGCCIVRHPAGPSVPTPGFYECPPQ